MLHAAAQLGHLDIVKFLLKNKANVSIPNGIHMTALQLAAEHGHLEIVKLLHQNGAKPNEDDLYFAVQSNQFEISKYLMESANVHDKCRRCDVSFYWLNGKTRGQSVIGTVSYLSHFQDGTFTKTHTNLSDVAFYNDEHLLYCRTALHEAVVKGFKELVLLILSKSRYALHCTDFIGRTPLDDLGYRKLRSILMFNLLASKLKVFSDELTITFLQKAIHSHPRKFNVLNECRDKDGYTILHRAIQGRNKPIIEQLLSWDANVTSSTLNGVDIVRFSILQVNPLLSELYDNLSEVSNEILNITYHNVEEASGISILLLQHVNKHRNYSIDCDSSQAKLTIYHLAAARGMVSFIKASMKMNLTGFDINCVNKHEVSPLYLARFYKGNQSIEKFNPWTETIKIIREHGGIDIEPLWMVSERLKFIYKYTVCGSKVLKEISKPVEAFREIFFGYRDFTCKTRAMRKKKFNMSDAILFVKKLVNGLKKGRVRVRIRVRITGLVVCFDGHNCILVPLSIVSDELKFDNEVDKALENLIKILEDYGSADRIQQTFHMKLTKRLGSKEDSSKPVSIEITPSFYGNSKFNKHDLLTHLPDIINKVNDFFGYIQNSTNNIKINLSKLDLDCRIMYKILNFLVMSYQRHLLKYGRLYMNPVHLKTELESLKLDAKCSFLSYLEEISKEKLLNSLNTCGLKSLYQLSDRRRRYDENLSFKRETDKDDLFSGFSREKVSWPRFYHESIFGKTENLEYLDELEALNQEDESYKFFPVNNVWHTRNTLM